MTPERRAALEAAGYRVADDPYEWLGLSPDEGRLIDLQLAVRKVFMDRLAASGMSRRRLAARLKVKASDVNRMAHAGGPLELLFRGLFLLGGSLTEVASVMRPEKPASRKPHT